MQQAQQQSWGHDRLQQVFLKVSEQEKVRRVEAGAEQLRQQGNVAFAHPDYTKAGQLYTRVLLSLLMLSLSTLWRP